jgi:3-deoxy-D-manno-octulosonate 8-phosphate phosphatase (KDO 8-P phosphatase)
METEKIISEYLAHVPESIFEKAKTIKVLITDIDGIMTDGGIIYDDLGTEHKKFNVKDGLIVQHLRKAKFLVGAITGRNSPVVENRCEELKFDFHYHGIRDKGKKLAEVLETMEVAIEEVAYIGDDLNDLPILCHVGLAVTPADALPYVKMHAHYVSPLLGGKGIFREVADILLHSKGQLIPLIENLSKEE